ncbi:MULTISPECIES: rhomboid family intramembrane serine protease [Pseudomonas]|uniref:Rhomboid family intramembrane serine protease n=1 Tax=Pseudomonas eucalypticola TaxID=2599595 RepID=A0A7D5GZI9_9PSED|nr:MULTISPECIES: rhomboid family intramembrane serine protease [Pseudomonas]QKZ03687.1 rhomboid family intramembrane serine protease [Pseudomonas eucalypticola]
MKPVSVMRLPLATDLSGFVKLLVRLQVPHRVSEESGQQVLWAMDEAMAADILDLYQRFPDGNADIDLGHYQPRPGLSRPTLAQQVRACPATALVLVICFIVAAVTLLGDNLDALHWLTFQDFSFDSERLYFLPLGASLDAGQWWRLFTPMLLHFGVLHLAMNALWYWELGKRVEILQGRINLVGLTLLFGLLSNTAQFWYSGPTLFGGLSGVLYGLLGHVFVYQWLAPNNVYRMPRGVMVMMLVWLLACMTPLVSVFGQIANAAHVGGLLVGCVTGLLGGAFARRKLRA